MFRYRINYQKNREIQYTGHLDLIRVWERSFRRALLPLAYSQGFHPQPRLNLAAPLPLGMTAQAELTDIWLTQTIPTADIQTTLQKALPQGIIINQMVPIPLSDSALQTITVSAWYDIILNPQMDLNQLEKDIHTLLNSSSVMRTRRNKTYDLRPLIEELALSENGIPAAIKTRLSAREGHTGRADELIAALNLDLADVHIRRTEIVLETD